MTAVARLPTLDATLGAGIDNLGLALNNPQRVQLIAFIGLLAKWNKTFNLTAIREPERMLTHHLLDALAVLPHLPTTAGLRVLDVGSGGGVPGIPLAIARPDWHVTMVDASQKKVAFQTQAAIELGLGNVVSQAARIEDYAPPLPFAIVIARAFSDLASLAALAARHLAPDGRMYAMKGAYPLDELAALPKQFKVVAAPALRVPGLDAERHLIVMELSE
ncbi:MAG TPA: 16S rRNA (guanine(527)-N(7))-methyltransferase RsmG [Casimicrobiaceae bacterium]